MQDGISEKVALTLTALATFVTAFVIAFIKYWKLTLILTSTVIAIVCVMGGGSSFIIKYNKQSLESYALGGSVAEEVISSIRNATAFGTQDKLARQYDLHLKEAEKWGLKLKIALAVMVGGMFGIIYLNYGLSFWQGSRYLVAGDMSLSDVLTIMLSIMIGSFSLGNGMYIFGLSSRSRSKGRPLHHVSGANDNPQLPRHVLLVDMNFDIAMLTTESL